VPIRTLITPSDQACGLGTLIPGHAVVLAFSSSASQPGSEPHPISPCHLATASSQGMLGSAPRCLNTIKKLRPHYLQIPMLQPLRLGYYVGPTSMPQPSSSPASCGGIAESLLHCHCCEHSETYHSYQSRRRHPPLALSPTSRLKSRGRWHSLAAYYDWIDPDAKYWWECFGG